MSFKQSSPRSASGNNPNNKQPVPSDTKKKDDTGSPVQNELQIQAKNSDKKR